MGPPRSSGAATRAQSKAKTPREMTEEANPAFKTRLLIILSFPLVFLVGLPWWWYTTSIERLPLPSARIEALETATPLDFRTSVLFTADPDAFPKPSPGGAQYTHEDVLTSIARQVTKGAEGILNQQRPAQRGKRLWDLVVDPKGIVHPLRIHIRVTDRANETFPLRPYIQAMESGLLTSGVPAGTLIVPVHPSQLGDRMLNKHYQIAVVKSLAALLPSVQTPPDIPHRALTYAPNITLSFVLLNQDASEGSYVRSWEVESAIQQHILPHLEPLKDVFNFTIESQVLYHAPLSFQPAKSAANGSEEYLVSEEEMKIFVNSEKWSLDSGSTNNPVLRFLLFVPSATHRPLHLAVPDSADSFLLPQYGAVTLVNPPCSSAKSFHLPLLALDPSFHLFTQHLYSLLALPALEPYIEPSLTSSPLIPPNPFTPHLSPWQVENVLRMRTRENSIEARKTLAGIVRLVAKIKEMKVGEGVRSKVLGAVEKLEKLDKSTDTRESFILSRDAVALANEAFFDPSMMGLLYFPDEHKFAVYTPLFAPISVPLIAGLVKILRNWLKSRRAARSQSTEGPSGTDEGDAKAQSSGDQTQADTEPLPLLDTRDSAEDTEQKEETQEADGQPAEPEEETVVKEELISHPSGRVLRPRKSASAQP